jgi:hypothetical protein
MKPITHDTIVKKNDDIFTGSIDNEMVAMSIQNGKYYQLNKTGSRILELLDKPRSIRELCETMQGNYSVDGGVCREDIFEFINEMTKLNLIIVV